MPTSFMEYWGRIIAAIMLIKMATTLVRDAEKLVTANVKARHPEIDADLAVEPLVETAEQNGGVSTSDDVQVTSEDTPNV